MRPTSFIAELEKPEANAVATFAPKLGDSAGEPHPLDCPNGQAGRTAVVIVTLTELNELKLAWT